MRIVVDYDQCDGTGLCTSIAPELFELDDDDMLQIRVPRPDETQRGLAEEAVQACPKLAIALVDGD